MLSLVLLRLQVWPASLLCSAARCMAQLGILLFGEGYITEQGWRTTLLLMCSVSVSNIRRFGNGEALTVYSNWIHPRRVKGQGNNGKHCLSEWDNGLYNRKQPYLPPNVLCHIKMNTFISKRYKPLVSDVSDTYLDYYRHIQRLCQVLHSTLCHPPEGLKQSSASMAS